MYSLGQVHRRCETKKHVSFAKLTILEIWFEYQWYMFELEHSIKPFSRAQPGRNYTIHSGSSSQELLFALGISSLQYPSTTILKAHPLK